MPSLFSRYATPFITGLFLVSLVSGIALFFHVGMATFHGMHEWLSMVLILPFVLHLWKNWRAFVTYFKRAPMMVALVVSVLISIPFALPSGESNRSGNPLIAVANLVQNGKLSAVAGLLGQPPEVFVATLKGEGWTVDDPQKSLKDVADANGKSSRDVASLLARLAKAPGAQRSRLIYREKGW